MKFDLHIHSKYSPDSFLSPEKIIRTAKKKGLDGVAVTDHDTIKGGLEAFNVNKDPDFQVIIGSEIRTQYGDILGLFLNEEIESNDFYNVVDEIKSQGGISVLAHPYRHYHTPEEIIEKVDLVESFNARSKRAYNVKSLKLAEKFDKPVTAGSDAHLAFEIGKGRIIIKDDIKKSLMQGETEISGNESSYYLAHGLSVAQEKIKMISSKLIKNPSKN